MVHPAPVLAEIDQQFPESLGRLFELLRFPSIGTDPAHHEDCRATAQWLVGQLKVMGFKASLRQTTGQPLVLGTYVPPGGDKLPHILFYGHYDVQPADPLELWTSPPFEPEIRKGSRDQDAIFARGSSDDKGQLMTFLEASRCWLKVHGALPFRLTVMIEGDEESDPAHIDTFLKENAAEFPVDAVFICDTGMWDERTPGIDTRLRGCMGIEFTVIGPKIDLHSGLYGGPVQNPIKLVSRIIAAIHDKRGRITIPGFYDGVKPIPAKLRKQWAALKFPAKTFLGDVGLGIPAGEQGFSALEQMWARPTAEVNGIYGGYRGVGSKTVLPAEATAKLTFRLVEGQDPKKIRAAFKAFVKRQLPKDCKVRFDDSGGNSTGISVSADTPGIRAAQAALTAEFGREPVLMGAGYSIPVVESFKKYLKVDSLLTGFGLADDNAHSPDEKYDVAAFHKGTRAWARIIAQFAKE